MKIPVWTGSQLETKFSPAKNSTRDSHDLDTGSEGEDSELESLEHDTNQQQEDDEILVLALALECSRKCKVGAVGEQIILQSVC